jgi:divalent metal cation (Fe/Co/Zn/Cd) transporter
VLGVTYVVVIAAGFIANRTTKDPVKDPHLAIAEILILMMAPVLLTLSAAMHYSVPADVRPYTLISLGWMVAAVATTSIVHLVELVVARRLRIQDFPAHQQVFGFRWPSILYAVDIAAWDIFFALAVLFAVPAFDGQSTVQVGLLATGLLALAGLVGPAVGNIAWRSIGIFGYAVVFPATCIPLSGYFGQLP